MAAKPAKLKPECKAAALHSREDNAPEQSTLFARAIPGMYSQLQRTMESKTGGAPGPSQLRTLLRNPQTGSRRTGLYWELETYLKGANNRS
jgi:hypothetical protein